MKKRIIILGSTGSVGTQALDVIREAPHTFEVVGLSANTDAETLQKQADEFGVKNTVLAEGKTEFLTDLVKNTDADLVLVAVNGAAGVQPTLAAIKSGKDIALANKETLVMEGEEVMETARKNDVQIIPVDSEHSAIFQCLQSLVPDAKNAHDVIKRGLTQVNSIILTCSGGPFFKKSRAEIEAVTPKEALAHPTWNMGKKITIDSATLVNKGLEIIEAHHLFGLDYDHIKVVVHPQSIVHGMVKLKNGNILMCASPPDMRIPIRYALHYPDAPPSPNGLEIKPLDPTQHEFEFLPPDHPVLKGIELGKKAGRAGKSTCQAFVKANDQAVKDFLDGKIKFLEIYERIKAEMAAH